MNEHEWPADAIEVQLAHANGGSVRGIYNMLSISISAEK